MVKIASEENHSFKNLWHTIQKKELISDTQDYPKTHWIFNIEENSYT